MKNLKESMHMYNVTFYMDSLDDNAMPGPTRTIQISAASEKEAEQILNSKSTSKYYIPVVIKIERITGQVGLDESSDYVATPAALDRDDIIEHLLDASEESDKHELIFNKCAAMIKQYKISANPDWDLSDILDTFSTKQLQELLQYVMDNYKTESLHEDANTDLEIPAPYNKYYEIGTTEIDYDELPDAFDHYKELKVVAEVYAKAEYDEALANNGLEFCWLVSDNGRLMLVTTVALRVYPVTLEEVEECVGSASDYDDYDDYEDLNESVEMTDAQRLALDELDSALECGEVSREHYDAALNIQYDINFEDVVLFISGVDVPLKDIEHVEYGDCTGEYDGCYSVTMRDGSIKKYGWYDADMSGALYHIEDCDEGILSSITGMVPVGLTEDTDGWEKPFNWTERYVKDVFVIYNNYQGGWHLEQTRPKTKHLGNFKTLEAAKAAGNKEIEKKNSKNNNKEPQWGVHQFSTDSIIFRGTEEECGNYINDREELWDDAEVYMITPDDPHYRGLNEGTGSDTAHVIRDVLTTASKEDKDGWAKTIVDIIDVIPDQYIDDLYDIAEEKLKDVKVTESEKKKLVDASGSDIDLSKDVDTVGKILALFDVHSWDAATLKKYVLVVLGIVAVIEPTPVLEIVTAIVSLLPADIVKTILSITNTIGNPVGAIGTLANRAYQASKNESYGDRFNPGDYVYVSVANRRGRVRKMISSDVVEVELDDNGVYPARIDRYYTNGVELIFSDDDLDDEF